MVRIAYGYVYASVLGVLCVLLWKCIRCHNVHAFCNCRVLWRGGGHLVDSCVCTSFVLFIIGVFIVWTCVWMILYFRQVGVILLVLYPDVSVGRKNGRHV